jgi:transposase
LDEVALSSGELYTVLTNSENRTGKGSLVAMVKGVKSKDLIAVLKKINRVQRRQVKEVATDLAQNMEKIARESFPKANIVNDRFHVAQLISEAVQRVRIKHRWEAIEEETELLKKSKELGVTYQATYYSNGDSKKQLLARSRFLLFKPESKWTDSQKKRGKILFKEFPEIHEVYKLSMMFRNIYQYAKSKRHAEIEFRKWLKKVEGKKCETLIKAAHSLESHKENILNYFENKTTNALAESFNSKLKAFRQQFRGVRDIPFFLFRLSNIVA